MSRPRTAERAAARSLPPIDVRLVLAVAAGGALGTLLRALAADHITTGPGAWPWATFAVNLLGAGLLGIVMVRAAGRPHLHGLLGTGFCGGLTTFSTMQLDVVHLLDDGNTALALAYAALSVGSGLMFARATARWAAARSADRGGAA